MKKPISLALAIFFVTPICVNAQEASLSPRPSTEANHSFSVDIFGAFYGAYYAYEQPLGRNVTIIGRVGALVDVGWFNVLFDNQGEFSLDIYPTIDIEPRFYYGLDRRAGKERSVAKNTGSFVSVQMKTVLPFAYVVSDNDTQPTGLIFISPLWGLRRIWNRHWLFEFSAGVSLFKENRKGIDWLPALNVRFGYSF